MEPVTDVLEPPAVGIVCDLERDGFTVQLEPDDVIVIVPRSRLTQERMRVIAASQGRNQGVAELL